MAEADRSDQLKTCRNCCFEREIGKSPQSGSFCNSEGTAGDEKQEPYKLDDLGLCFNKRGMLKSFDNVYFDMELANFEKVPSLKWKLALEEATAGFLCDHLEKKYGMVKVIVPIDPTTEYAGQTEEPYSFIYHTPDFFVNEKLVVLIHGGGDVHIGQWSKRQMLQNNLKTGSQIPYIQRARAFGYAVVLLNTNLTHKKMKGDALIKIRENETPEKHALYVFREIIMQKLKTKHIAVIAHGYGGNVVVNMLASLKHDFLKKVFAVCLIDSTHRLGHYRICEEMTDKFIAMSRNWVVSAKEINRPVPKLIKKEVECISAGTTKYDSAPWYCFVSIFEFINQKYCDLKGLDCVIKKEEPTVKRRRNE